MNLISIAKSRSFNLPIYSAYKYRCYCQSKDKSLPNPNKDTKPFERVESPRESKDTAFQFFTWRRLVYGLGGGLIIVAALRYLKSIKDEQVEEERRKHMGKMLIGGDWTLTDQNGKTVTNKDFMGKWILLYFGFTHCPDICPDEMEKMCKAVDIIDEENKKNGTNNAIEIVPIYVSVDPERDTPAIIKKYCAEFSPKMVGLTGTPDQIQHMSKTFRVYFSKGPIDKTSKEYIVDHTIITYLIDPKSEFVDYYGRTKTAEDIANGIKIQTLKYNKANKRFSFL